MTVSGECLAVRIRETNLTIFGIQSTAVPCQYRKEVDRLPNINHPSRCSQSQGQCFISYLVHSLLTFRIGCSRRYQVWKHTPHFLPLSSSDGLFILLQTNVPSTWRPLRLFIFLRYLWATRMLHRTGTILHLRLQSGWSEKGIRERRWGMVCEEGWEDYRGNGCL